MDSENLLGAKIRHLRKSKNISQEKLSEMAGISPRQMIRIELGRSKPTLDNLEKIAIALGVSIQSLFENDYYETINILKKKLHEKLRLSMKKYEVFVYYCISVRLGFLHYIDSKKEIPLR